MATTVASRPTITIPSDDRHERPRRLGPLTGELLTHGSSSCFLYGHRILRWLPHFGWRARTVRPRYWQHARPPSPCERRRQGLRRLSSSTSQPYRPRRSDHEPGAPTSSAVALLPPAGLPRARPMPTTRTRHLPLKGRRSRAGSSSRSPPRRTRTPGYDPARADQRPSRGLRAAWPRATTIASTPRRSVRVPRGTVSTGTGVSYSGHAFRLRPIRRRSGQLRTCGAARSARRPVKAEVAGSNPVRSATGHCSS